MVLLYLIDPPSVGVGKMNIVEVIGLAQTGHSITCFFLLALSANDCLFAIIYLHLNII